ncbi:TIGR02678 family protein [Saccharomonospora saliphila]|uniref:TIGR02678 family protein n=1 Tax=Saccharomonospora saliphila TaxID=369829 RepID=UPI00037A6748|nr:TIGR02678 family protein [Saccharomonospora saliphila]
MSNLGNQLVAAEQEEVARGIRLLLGRPLLTKQHEPEAFDLVRRRQQPIELWFDYNCGWPLTVEPRLGYARLAKIRQPDETRPARRSRSNRAPFDRRRYTLLCVVAAELLSGPVTTIGLLADRVRQATATDDKLETFDTARHGERKAYVDVLRLLESFGALTTVDGVTESFVDSREAKVLYRVDTTLVLRLLAAPSGPSRSPVPPEEVGLRWPELVDGLLREPRYGDGESPTTDVRRNLWLRHSIFRRLFDDPVLYDADLTDDQRAYLRNPRGRQLLRAAAEQAGFVLEERAEGYLLVDPDALATDRTFPGGSGTVGGAALLVLDRLVAADTGLTVEQLHAEASGLLREYPHWARQYRDDDGPARLVSESLSVLTTFGLAVREAGRVRALPAAARYTVTEIRQ